MFGNSGQRQKGEHNQQAGRDIHNTTNNIFEKEINFDLVETEKIIDDLYDIAQTVEAQEDFTIKRMDDISEKNKLNDMEGYFDSRIKEDIAYFGEIQEVLNQNEEDFIERFTYIIRTIKGAILAIDSREELTPVKIHKIMQKFYKQEWDVKKKTRAERLIHFMYFSCFIGKKEV